MVLSSFLLPTFIPLRLRPPSHTDKNLTHFSRFQSAIQFPACRVRCISYDSETYLPSTDSTKGFIMTFTDKINGWTRPASPIYEASAGSKSEPRNSISILYEWLSLSLNGPCITTKRCIVSFGLHVYHGKCSSYSDHSS